MLCGAKGVGGLQQQCFAWVSGCDVPPISLGTPRGGLGGKIATDQKSSAFASRCSKLLCLP